MAGNSVFRVSFDRDGILEPASPSLQNCIKFSNSGKYLSALCDFGAVSICQLTDMQEATEDFKVVLVKRLRFSKGELLEGHAWSSDDEIFAVAGCKIYLFKVCQGFTSLHTIPLYYLPKDISLILAGCPSLHKVYSLAVAGPNGVELYQMEISDNFKMGSSSSLHSDLAIPLVKFSPDEHYLAVAALDGHFGIWTVSSLEMDQKEFWYIHLKTVRITSMEFSPDSTMVAVAGWEGSWHLYRKIVQDDKVTWEKFHFSASVDRVSGDLPGSFISWSPDNRFVRLTQCSDKTSCLSTFDTQTSVTTDIPLDGIVKGITSFRRISGDYTLCMLRAKQYFLVKWPTSEPASVKATAAYREETKLLFQESLEGSLLVERSVTGGVTLQWRRTPQDILAALKKIGEKGSEITDNYKTSEMRQCSMRETISDCENQPGKEEPRSVQCNHDEIVGAEVLDLDDDHVESLTDCIREDNGQHFMKSSKCSSQNTELSNKRSTGESQNGQTNEHKSLKEAGRDSPGVTFESRVAGSSENTSRNTSQIGNVLSTSQDNNSERVYTSQTGGFFTKGRLTKSNEQSNIKRTSRLSNEVVSIEAPFLNPRLFQNPDSNSLSPSLSSTVKLLISTYYVIVAILPLLAYVYHYEKGEWNSLLFPVAVKNCCIAQGKYLVLLTNEGGVRIWCLQSMTMLYSSHKVLCATKSDFERYIVTGHLFEPQFSIVKLDKAGEGEVLCVSFQPDYSDCSVSVTRLPVCYPDLLGVSRTSHAYGCVGRLIIFKEQQYSEDGDETSRDHQELSFVKWIVILPELRISSSFLDEPNCSLEQFIVRHHTALGELANLTVTTL